MLLTRPLLLRAVKMRTSVIDSASPIVSAISADARAWYVSIYESVFGDQTCHQVEQRLIPVASSVLNMRLG